MTAERQDDSDTLRSTRRRRDLPRPVWALVLARTVNRLGGFSLTFLDRRARRRPGRIRRRRRRDDGGVRAGHVPSRLAGGRLADRIGRVRTICLGLIGCAVAQLWIAASPTAASAFVGVVALGLAFELYEPPSQALVADLTTDEQRPIAYGLLSAALAAAGAGAGLLAVLLGAVDLRLLLVADAVTCLATAAIVALVVHDPGAACPVTRPRLVVTLARPAPARAPPRRHRLRDRLPHDRGHAPPRGLGPWNRPRARRPGAHRSVR